ncbi:PQQ-dependent sugar dehydrogenase [Fodinibius saliphilus]|uniref:PQQ-dependent sugar dehydrogenase n=1 Tax=Fodinibius saliphilus TaxID=1920650 RepID=UPI0011085266|nr:PQQ-dependent sugar dehydrogenase [Fodinibius saliphilus]
MVNRIKSVTRWGLLLFMILGCSSTPPSENIIKKLTLPEDFSVEVYAEDLPDVRQLARGDDGTIYAGSRNAGKVYAIADRNNDFKADKVYVIAENLRLPSGIAYREGDLYIGAVSKILKLTNIDSHLQDPPEPKLITEQYPTDGHHGWKFIAFGPDGKLYVPVGAPCNICNPDKDIFATITRINTDGTNRKIIAKGVRNSVGFDWHPKTGELWFTDNGRDWMGDNRPPCELNHLTKKGQHFGYPYVHGNNIQDPKFGDTAKHIDTEFKAPAQELGPHVAPLGMIFYTGDMFPDSFKNQILIAEHGSWNRSKKIGYRITKVNLKNGEPTSYKPFINGWLQEQEAVWGRPVDLLQLSDGSVLISDDHSGTIYRVTYNS